MFFKNAGLLCSLLLTTHLALADGDQSSSGQGNGNYNNNGQSSGQGHNTAVPGQTQCLPEKVRVKDENGAMVQVSRTTLERYSLFKGALVSDGSASGVTYSSNAQYVPTCGGGSSDPTYIAVEPHGEAAPGHEGFASAVGSDKAVYEARIVDVDQDGLSDIFIYQPNPFYTRVNRFYLKRFSGNRFELRQAAPHHEERARYTAPSEIVVSRDDFNADGLYDFIIANIDEYFPGADDQIIITKRGDTANVGKMLPINDKFRAVRNGIESINAGGATDFYVGLYDNTIFACQTYWLPYYVWDWSFESWRLYWVPYNVCDTGRNFLRDNLKHSEHFDYIKSLSKMNATYGLNSFQGAAGTWYGSVYAKVSAQLDPRQLVSTARWVRNGAQVWRAGSITATVILIADDATVVGVLDDIALPATLASVAASFIFIEALDYYIEVMAENPGSGDTGKKDRSHYGAGTFAIPDYCDPKQPGQIEAGNNEGRSQDLRKNLEDTGCWCFSRDVRGAAHHIIPKAAGDELGEQLRSCLKNKRDIDIDSAINGVCLPQSEAAESAAFLHAGNENVLHADRLPGLLELCEDDSLSRDDFIDKLRDIADGYTKGEIRIP